MPRRTIARRLPPPARALALGLLLTCALGPAGAASLTDATPPARASRFT
jgi:hypothetical protein